MSCLYVTFYNEAFKAYPDTFLNRIILLSDYLVKEIVTSNGKTLKNEG